MKGLNYRNNRYRRQSRYNITDKEKNRQVLKEEIPINVRIIISDKAEQH